MAAKKADKAKITAKVDKKKYTCTVTVKKKKKATTEEPTTETPKPQGPAVGAGTPVEKNASDVAILQKIIDEQRALGATVPTDLDSYAYTWDANGRLTYISWSNYNLQGTISFEGLTALTDL
ncbi:MAG: hypothetical protein NC300_01480 [Bacteroidales bacterium]|nr:hypothetical protein [Clostridium sp.]MCM1202796.1 hypothetical protein [Bacteroidales bacterium]